MKKILLPLCLLLLTATTLAGCSDKEEKPEYKTPEGLHVITAAEYSGSVYFQNREVIGPLYFYSDTFPMLTLRSAVITIFSLTENEIMLAKRDETDIYPSLSYSLANKPFIPSINFPNCSTKGYAFFVDCYLPKELGHSDCYFRIEDPAQNIYYQTPPYRITLAAHESGDGWYTVSIKELN